MTTRTEESKVLSDRFHNRTVKLGLSSSLPARDGTGATEPVHADYARISIVDTGGNKWGTPQAGAGASDPSYIENTASHSFATATADWSFNAKYYLLFNDSDVLIDWMEMQGTPAAGRPILEGDVITIFGGDLRFEQGHSTDNYS